MSEIAAKPQLPEQVVRVATEHRLGRLQSIHVAISSGSVRLGGGVVAIILGVAMSGAYLLIYESILAWLPWWQAIIVPLIGIVWIVIGCWVLFAPFFLPRFAVYVYTEGLLYAARKIEVIHWRKMERIWKSGPRPGQKPGIYVVQRNDKQHFEFKPDLSDLASLGNLLEQEITQRLLPRAIGAYVRGETVIFAQIAITEQGIILREGRRKLAWIELEKLLIDEKRLEWYRCGDTRPWASIALGAVPNVEVLRGLVSYAQRAQLRETAPKIVAYRAGETIDFGALHVSQKGINLTGSAQLIPWNEIAGIGISENEVIIGRKDTGQWYTFPDWMIQDAGVLKDLVEYVLQKRYV